MFLIILQKKKHKFNQKFYVANNIIDKKWIVLLLFLLMLIQAIKNWNVELLSLYNLLKTQFCLIYIFFFQLNWLRQFEQKFYYQIIFFVMLQITPLNSLIMHNSEHEIDTRQMSRIKYPPFVRINRCYSCMSPLYEQFFRTENSHLAKFFYEPRNFTSQCDEPMNINKVGVVPCRAICLTLIQEFTVMGRKTGKLLTMRGCATSLSRFGFYNRTFALFDQYDMCREVFANELFRYDTDSQPIKVCSCLGDRCNGASKNNSFSHNITLFLYIFVFALNIRQSNFFFNK